MAGWPKDNPTALKAFYGDPGTGEVERQLVPVVPPFKMFYEGKPVKSIRFHKKAAPALLAALNEIWEIYDRDQAAIDKEGLSDFGGSYNARKIRGSATRWSNHAYGAAIDLDAKNNGLGTRGDMPASVVAAFKRQGAKWGGDYKGRKDPMHFEFVDNGETAPPVYGLLSDDADPHEAKPSYFARVRNWLASISGFGFLAYLTDWQIAAIIFGFALLVLIGGIAFALWLFGKDSVRNFIRRQVV